MRRNAVLPVARRRRAARGAPVNGPVVVFVHRGAWADRYQAVKEAGAARVAPLRETVEEARRELGLEVVACDTAVRLVGLDPEALGGTIDRVVTLPQLWKAARDGTHVVI
jgi:hypothetical protein